MEFVMYLALSQLLAKPIDYAYNETYDYLFNETEQTQPVEVEPQPEPLPEEKVYVVNHGAIF